jgi:DNA-binding transcriptional MerR regulator
MRNVDHLKPENFQHYLTISEVARAVDRDISWIRKLEAEGRIPQAKRVQRGALLIRLWSPQDVEEIQQVLATLRPGRPSRG